MSANFMTKQHAAGKALAAKRGQINVSDLSGAEKSMHDNLTESELEEFAQAKFNTLVSNKQDDARN